MLGASNEQAHKCCADDDLLINSLLNIEEMS